LCTSDEATLVQTLTNRYDVPTNQVGVGRHMASSATVSAEGCFSSPWRDRRTGTVRGVGVESGSSAWPAFGPSGPWRHCVGAGPSGPSSILDALETECPTQLRHRGNVVTLQVTRHCIENLPARGRIDKAGRAHLARCGPSDKKFQRI